VAVVANVAAAVVAANVTAAVGEGARRIFEIDADEHEEQIANGRQADENA
jgi:uncharacterized protein (DUF697 family)